jgi:hypothetical protein
MMQSDIQLKKNLTVRYWASHNCATSYSCNCSQNWGCSNPCTISSFFALTSIPADNYAPKSQFQVSNTHTDKPSITQISCPFLLYLSICFFCHPGLAPYWIPHAQRQIADTSLALFPLLERSQENQLIRDLNWQPPVKKPLNFFVLLFF